MHYQRISTRFIPARKIFAQIPKRCETTSATASLADASNISEWENARSFEEIPRLGMFEAIRAYMPGGKYYNMDINKVMLKMNKEFGNVVYIPPFAGNSLLMSFNPNDFETVFRNEGIWPVRLGAQTMEYHRKTHRADFFKGVGGLLTTQGEQWGKFRSAVNPVLMQPKKMRLYLNKMSQVNQEFIDKIREIRDPETHEMPADFESFINQWTLESVSIVALDRQLGLLKDKNIDPRILKFRNAVNEFIKLSGEIEFGPSLWRIIATPKFKRLMKAHDDMLETISFYVSKAVQRVEAEKKSGIEKPENEKGVLEKLLKIDPQIATVMAMDMLMAGVDSTTGTFAGILLCLAKNPEKQEKLREEVRRILPHKNSDFTEKSLNEIPYLRACIKESLRIYPVVISNIRMVQRNVVLSGYRVPKGTHVCMHFFSAHNDEKYYPKPNEFIPERWLRASKDEDSQACPNSVKSKNSFMYLPFGFGPRSCIGRRIAEMELELGIARIIRNFNVAYDYPTEKAFKQMLINLPNIPLKFKMTEVNS